MGIGWKEHMIRNEREGRKIIEDFLWLCIEMYISIVVALGACRPFWEGNKGLKVDSCSS